MKILSNACKIISVIHSNQLNKAQLRLQSRSSQGRCRAVCGLVPIPRGSIPHVTGCQPKEETLVTALQVLWEPVSYPARRPPIQSVSCQFAQEELWE